MHVVLRLRRPIVWSCMLLLVGVDPASTLMLHVGGDGGVIREVVKHKGVKDITICEIDQVSACACRDGESMDACAHADVFGWDASHVMGWPGM